MAIEFKEHCMAAEGPGRSLWVREHAPALAGAADAAPPHHADVRRIWPGQALSHQSAHSGHSSDSPGSRTRARPSASNTVRARSSTASGVPAWVRTLSSWSSSRQSYRPSSTPADPDVTSRALRAEPRAAGKVIQVRLHHPGKHFGRRHMRLRVSAAPPPPRPSSQLTDAQRPQLGSDTRGDLPDVPGPQQAGRERPGHSTSSGRARNSSARTTERSAADKPSSPAVSSADATSPDPAPSPWSLSPISATAARQPASPGRPGVLFNAARFPEGRPSCSAWREASPEDCPGALEAVSGLRYHPGSPATSDHPIPTSRSSCRSAHRCSAERYSAAFSTSTTERRERLRKPAGQTRRRILKRYRRALAHTLVADDRMARDGRSCDALQVPVVHRDEP